MPSDLTVFQFHRAPSKIRPGSSVTRIWWCVVRGRGVPRTVASMMEFMRTAFSDPRQAADNDPYTLGPDRAGTRTRRTTGRGVAPRPARSRPNWTDTGSGRSCGGREYPNCPAHRRLLDMLRQTDREQRTDRHRRLPRRAAAAAMATAATPRRWPSAAASSTGCRTSCRAHRPEAGERPQRTRPDKGHSRSRRTRPQPPAPL